MRPVIVPSIPAKLLSLCAWDSFVAHKSYFVTYFACHCMVCKFTGIETTLWRGHSWLAACQESPGRNTKTEPLQFWVVSLSHSCLNKCPVAYCCSFHAMTAPVWIFHTTHTPLFCDLPLSLTVITTYPDLWCHNWSAHHEAVWPG